MTGYQFPECKRLEAPLSFSIAGGAANLRLSLHRES
jgi:hypothetical protein